MIIFNYSLKADQCFGYAENNKTICVECAKIKNSLMDLQKMSTKIKSEDRHDTVLTSVLSFTPVTEQMKSVIRKYKNGSHVECIIKEEPIN